MMSHSGVFDTKVILGMSFRRERTVRRCVVWREREKDFLWFWGHALNDLNKRTYSCVLCYPVSQNDKPLEEMLSLDMNDRWSLASLFSLSWVPFLFFLSFVVLYPSSYSLVWFPPPHSLLILLSFSSSSLTGHYSSLFLLMIPFRSCFSCETWQQDFPLSFWRYLLAFLTTRQRDILLLHLLLKTIERRNL
jgi:hypothetical protein